MAALPKKKLSRARARTRRAANKYISVKLVSCAACGGQKLPHRVCPHCGSYASVTVFEPKEAVKVTRVANKESRENKV